MEHCTSLDDGIVPGRCTTDARIIQKKPVVPVAPKVPKPVPVVKKSSSSAAKSSSSSIKSSSSSSVMQSGSSSSIDMGALAKTMQSMMESFASWGKSITSSLTSMAESFKCTFGGC